MSRIQLALNVPDIDEAVDFYARLFATAPHKRRPGYANFAVADPPVKLVLFENPGAADLNHLGVEVETAAEVAATGTRLTEAGLAPTNNGTVVCCHAEQDKLYVDGAGTQWEFYTITDDLLDDQSTAIDAAAATDSCCTHAEDTAAACC